MSELNIMLTKGGIYFTKFYLMLLKFIFVNTKSWCWLKEIEFKEIIDLRLLPIPDAILTTFFFKSTVNVWIRKMFKYNWNLSIFYNVITFSIISVMLMHRESTLTYWNLKDVKSEVFVHLMLWCTLMKYWLQISDMIGNYTTSDMLI